ELRARAGQLDEAREPESHVAPFGAGRLLLAPQLVVTRNLEKPCQRGLIAATVEDVAGHRGVRKLLGAYENAAAHLGWIESQIARGAICHACCYGVGEGLSDRA